MTGYATEYAASGTSLRFKTKDQLLRASEPVYLAVVDD